MIEIRVGGELIDPATISKKAPRTHTWCALLKPTEDEITQVSTAYKIPTNLLEASLDDEELPRAHVDDGYTFVVLDVPHVEKDIKGTMVFQTYPMVIVVVDDVLITATNYDIGFMKRFREEASTRGAARPKGCFGDDATDSALRVIRNIADSFIRALTTIYEVSSVIEKDLQRLMRNKQLVEMLAANKSLVYLSTSLRGNLGAIRRLESLPEFASASEQAILAETHVEIGQALEMSGIYQKVLDSTMNVFSGVISNNLNDVMKLLTSVTIIITIPMIFAGFWGMNVPIPLKENPYGFPIVIGLSLVVSFFFTWWFRRRNYF